METSAIRLVEGDALSERFNEEVERQNMIKTTYFWKAIHEPDVSEKYVSISRQKMRGAETMSEYPALMPSWDIIQKAHQLGYNEESFLAYRDAYFAQLDELDARKVYNDLQGCVLVCFESSNDLYTGKKFCHRRMVAGWLEEKLGIEVPEETRTGHYVKVPAIYRDTTYSELQA